MIFAKKVIGLSGTRQRLQLGAKLLGGVRMVMLIICWSVRSKPTPWIVGTSVEVAVSAVSENKGTATLGTNA